jgi:hypothetical protein
MEKWAGYTYTAQKLHETIPPKAEVMRKAVVTACTQTTESDIQR